ncbi:MAG: DUF6512 family protein [Candidatus Berkelbacteria bacterium]|nr:DUF6512 family protein [Candidatus Berkelbacteria bacterium]
MDKKPIRNLSIIGAVVVVVLGTLLHFAYGLSGNNFIVGLITPVNESVWEHMKLIMTPLIIFAFIEWYYLKGKVSNFCFSLLKQAGVGIIFIIAFFYIYTYFTGESILALDIGSFVVGAILAKWLGYAILVGKFKKFEFKGLNILSAIILTVVFAFFIYATIDPPKVGLFKDPVEGSFGIYEKNS